MKVLSIGNKQEKEYFIKICECGNCGSTLELEDGDLGRYLGRSPEGDFDWDYAAFKCPLCYAYNRFEVPLLMLSELTILGPRPLHNKLTGFMLCDAKVLPL